MKAVIQRVKNASVCVDEKTVGEVGKGYMLLLGVMSSDTNEDAEILARKVVSLRVFSDENDKMNLSVLDVDGEILSVSQFTLCADVKKGNRPSFTPSASPDEANRLYDYFCRLLEQGGVKKVARGVFGADMAVSLINDGPVTICLDTEIWRKHQ